MSEMQDLWSWARGHYHELWLLYAAVAFGFAGFAFTETYRAIPRIAKGVLGLVFVLFALTSVKSVLETVALEREALRLLGWAADPARAELARLMEPPPTWLVLVIHAGALAAVLVALAVSSARARRR